MPQCLKLPRVDAMPFAFETLLRNAGQRQIHVVAAEQDVIANGDALQREIPVLLADQNQTEVGRAAADIADQHQVAGAELPPPAVTGAVDPRIARRLWLLEQ